MPQELFENRNGTKLSVEYGERLALYTLSRSLALSFAPSKHAIKDV
jgi:hypothetical protein